MSAVRDIFLRFYDRYRAKYSYNQGYHKAATAIMKCKSGELGLNVSICGDCGEIHTHYNSCRNRHCPGCQSIPREVWIDARKAEVVDGISYFHAIFTVPIELRALMFRNQEALYALFHKCVSESILELSEDKKYLGAKPGIIQVLHTWGGRLNYHPHIHTIIMGCGLTKALQVVQKPDFFIPVKVLSRKFRGKFLSKLNGLHGDGELRFSPSTSHLEGASGWGAFLDMLYSKEWVPFIKETFNGSGNALEYLGRYTHRVAISNYRILKVTDSTVTFTYLDYKSDTNKELTLNGVEFVRRFLTHVLPKGFVKIRYYGVLSNRMKKKNLKLLFHKLSVLGHKAKLAGLKAPEILKMLYDVDISRCKRCKSENFTYRRTYYMRN
jgi:predicted Zn-ribbon and HTH transcriptional regulator